MNKYIDIKNDTFMVDERDTKKDIIIIPSEAEFKTNLYKIIGRKYKIIKSTWIYSPIDFVIINKENLKTIYVELKSRSKRYLNYTSVMINYSKIKNFQENFSNTIMIFQYEDTYKYTLFKKDMIHYPTNKQSNNQDVIYIQDTELIRSNLEDLGKYIIKQLK